MIIYSVYAVFENNRKEFMRSFSEEEVAEFFVRIMKALDKKDGLPENIYKIDASYLFSRKDVEDCYPEYKDA